MASISVPALYDNNNQFLNGTLVSIDINSTIVGTEQKPQYPAIPGYATPFVSTLRVADPNRGTFYLNMNMTQYEVAVSAALQDINKEITTKYTIGASPVSTITDTTHLFNITINAILVDNGPIDISTITYTPLTDSTITFPTPLPATSVVQIIYNKN